MLNLDEVEGLMHVALQGVWGSGDRIAGENAIYKLCNEIRELQKMIHHLEEEPGPGDSAR